MATAIKQKQQKVKELRLLPIIKHSKEYTGSKGTRLHGVLYTGDSFVASDGYMLIEVPMEYPGLEPGARIDHTGNKITLHIKAAFPTFEHLFRYAKDGELILNLTERAEIKKLVTALTEAHRATKDVRRKMDHRVTAFRQDKHGAYLTAYHFKAERKKRSKNLDAIEERGNFNIPAGKVIGELKQTIYLRSRHLLRAVEVLYQHGATMMEIHVSPSIVYVFSDVGRAVLVPVRVRD